MRELVVRLIEPKCKLCEKPSLAISAKQVICNKCSNLPLPECNLCFSSWDPTCLRLNCQHWFHPDCLALHIESLIRSRTVSDEDFVCPACPSRIEKSLIDEVTDPEQLEILEKIERQNFLSSVAARDPDLQLIVCSCEYPILISIDTTETSVDCNDCGNSLPVNNRESYLALGFR